MKEEVKFNIGDYIKLNKDEHTAYVLDDLDHNILYRVVDISGNCVKELVNEKTNQSFRCTWAFARFHYQGSSSHRLFKNDVIYEIF